MKNFLAIFLLLLGFSSLSQNPQGKLFFHTNNYISNDYGTMGYIQYPDNLFTIIDTLHINDIDRTNDTLFTGGKNIYYYNIETNQKIDSILDVDANIIRTWKNHLVISSLKHPYFKVYDVNNKSLTFSLDSSTVRFLATDMLISGNKAFLLFEKSFQVIDLSLQDTIISKITPHPYTWAGYNMYFIEALERLFIDVEYATGATRFSILELDEHNFNINLVFHKEFEANFYRPLAVGDRIYMLGFDSYYDITPDTLIVNAQYEPVAIEYDIISNSFFLYNPSNLTINYFRNGVYSDSIILPSTIKKAIFINDSITGIQDLTNETHMHRIFPNPTSGLLYTELKYPELVDWNITVFDILGNRILSKSVSQTEICKNNLIEYDLSLLTNGSYIIRLNSQDIVLTEMILLIK